MPALRLAITENYTGALKSNGKKPGRKCFPAGVVVYWALRCWVRVSIITCAIFSPEPGARRVISVE